MIVSSLKQCFKLFLFYNKKDDLLLITIISSIILSMFSITILTIDGSFTIWFERYLCIFSTVITNDVKHFTIVYVIFSTQYISPIID